MSLPLLLSAYLAGLGLAPLLYLEPWTPLLPLAAGTLWLILRRQRPAGVLLLLFLATFALARYQLELEPPAGRGHIADWAGKGPLVVGGTLVAAAGRPGGRSIVDVAAERVVADGLSWPVQGRVRIYLDDPGTGFSPGQQVRLRTELRRPKPFGTPGEFDYPRHLARLSIHAVGRLDRSADLAVMAGIETGPDVLIGSWRTAAGRFIDRTAPPAQAPMLRALLIGDQSLLSPADRDLLAAGGVAHLFAVSGMHLGLVAGFLYLVAQASYRRSSRLLLLAPPRRVLPLALLPVLYFYLHLTGNALATNRAFLAAAGVALGLTLGRRTPPLRLLAAVALVLLLVDPLAGYEPSFQLSVAGTAGILAGLPRAQPLLANRLRCLRWPATVLLTTAAATLATLPLVLWHFHRLAPAGLPANLLAVPLVGGLALPLGLAGLTLAPPAPALAAVLLQGSALAIRWVQDWTALLVAWPPLAGGFWYPPPLTMVGIGFLVIALLASLGRCSRRLLTAGLAGAGLALCLAPTTPPAGLTVTAISVGQGDAFLVTLEDGRHLLVDGGGSRDPGFDVGERLTAPALGALGVRRLAAVVLSHNHPDHSQGLRQVLAAFQVGEIWVGADQDTLPPDLVEIIRARGVPVRRFDPGWHTPWPDRGPSLGLFAPPAAAASVNDRSLVLYAGLGRDGVLLTGDLEAAGIGALLETTLPGPVTLLKLPHHGSWHSGPIRLLNRLEPRLVFVSAGRDNPFRLPDVRTVAAVEGRGLPLWRTDRDGTLRFFTRGQGWQPMHWEKGLFR